MPLSDQTKAPVLAIIGGTGIETLEGFTARETLRPTTPFGELSGGIVLGALNGVEVALLNRHGLLAEAAHTQHIPPHAINYRANIWALSRLGVKQILALNAVGGISSDWPPGRLGTPNDLIDYSYGRAHSFFDPDSALPYHYHVEFSQPFNAALTGSLLEAASLADVQLTESGVLAVTNGPRLETPAEVARLERDGCDLVGMTSMPEAALAAESELDYASLAFSVNWAAGKGEPGMAIHSEIAATIADCQKQIAAVLGQLVSLLA